MQNRVDSWSTIYVPGMPFMVFIPSGSFTNAVLRVVGHAADEFDPLGDIGGDQVVPDDGAPAGDFCDAVAERHCSEH